MTWQRENAERSLHMQVQSQVDNIHKSIKQVESNAGGNKVNLELVRFDGSDRFYVTKGTASTGLFYDQRSALTAEARAKLWD